MVTSSPLLGLILLLPAIGVVFNLFAGYRQGRKAVYAVGVGVIAGAFVISAVEFARLATLPAGSALHLTLWHWLAGGPFAVDVALRMDALSGVMLLFITGVGALIHLYSCGYMEHDPDYARFFAYMNLFMLSMLLLVMASNLLLMFVGWEGVGLCSYLLISFWYSNSEFAYNGRKAFIVNRVGDAGFILGILTLVGAMARHGVWSLEFADLSAHANFITPATASAVGLLLFIGATGKSAQIPLYVWLPDAMVGPTPVSALIHAATMVTAGVYMVARMSFLFRLTPETMNVVATIGAVTAFFAATIALVQTDIKRVLAYSTISQLGYMFLGAGAGAFAAGIFHVVTHAFFKALLFLCAGSVMHALGGEQDMNNMGGLRKRLPITYYTMLAATLAISAVPGFSGYFSKDQILEAAYASGHGALWLLGVLTAGLTSLYMFRLIFLTFWGTSRVAPEREPHVHESPPVMTIPLVILAVLATVGGLIGLPEGMLWGDAIGRFLSPVVGRFQPTVEASEFALSMLATAASLTGIGLAYILYVKSPALPGKIAHTLYSLYRLLRGKYFIDELYDFLVSRPLFFVATRVLGGFVDRQLIDGAVNGSAAATAASGAAVRRIETGNIQDYVLTYVIGAVALFTYSVYVIMELTR